MNQQDTICIISGEGEKRVSFYVTERIINNLNQGDGVTIEKNGSSYDGVITDVSAIAEDGNGLFKVKAELPEAEALPAGTTVRVTVVAEQADQVMTVPVDAVYYDGGEGQVYIYENGTVHKTEVEVGLYDSRLAEIKSGLSGDELVISTWSSQLYEGSTVRLQGQEGEASAPVSGETEPGAKETEPIEDAVSTLEGVDSITSSSRDGSSRVMLEYDYGTDMDEAYDALKQKLDGIERSLPEDVEPSVMEMNMNSGAGMMLSISHGTQENLYDYVDQQIVPELERISTIANIETMGGSSKYVKIELQSEKMDLYGLTMSDVSNAISQANLSSPSGEAVAGNLELSVTTSLETKEVEALGDIPIRIPAGQMIALSDVADIYETEEDRGGISRYSGQETITVSIQKQQDATDMEVSKAVHETIEELMAGDSDLTIEVANDTSETILDSLYDVAETMVMAVVISMFIIFLFFGDYKASLIVGSSIPVSILLSLIALTMAGFSLNVITMSALVLGVGMMVDNSIVVLESCFRATAAQADKGALGYFSAALHGTGVVINSIIGSTVTTCVVFIPLAFLDGMTGQMFKPLGYTVVFCMSASLLSAMTIVPLCYLFYKPTEARKALMGRPVEKLQNMYRAVMERLLEHKGMVMGISVLILAATLVLAGNMQTELMPADDTGTVSVSIETRPGLRQEKVEDALNQAEAIVAASGQVDSYVLRYNQNSGTITAYLKEDRTVDTEETAEQWQSEMDRIVKEMTARSDVINVHSSIENNAPIVTLKVNPVMAKAYGLTASEIGNTLNQMLSGIKATTLKIDGEDISVNVEYPEGQYETVGQISDILLTSSDGRKVALTEVADVVFEDSPSSISKTDGSFEISISADYTGGAVQQTIDSEVIAPNLTGTITIGQNSRDRMMKDEFSSLYGAIATATFLVFVVMAAQFESVKFSIMVMTTIPFSLVGTVVNNGILYVDTVNQYRMEMGLRKALIEAGATRIRPILMTSLTTILSMIPMALAIGSSGSTTQGLAIVDIGGLTAGIFVALFMVPVYYALLSRRPREPVPDID